MSPILDMLTVAFMFVVRIVVPILILFGVLYWLKSRLEPRTIEERLGPAGRRLRLSIPPVLISLVSLALLAVIIGIGYALVTNQFVDLLLRFRDVAVLAYLFILRVAVPLILLIGIGTWLEHKLHPGEMQDRPPLSARVPALKRIHLPQVTAKGLLAITLITALWAAFIGVTIARFFFGLSFTTNMNDTYPWGIWISIDVMSGVALAAGGFVMAGTVHVFNLKQYHPIVRPAILTAFLGYLLVIVGLLFDLGRWYNVWHAMVMWNLHSPLIEVAWCVILYTTVLALEFSPIVFEKFNLQWPLRIMRRITVPLVIAGMCLSTLHQSTLGTLMLVFPEKMNPLWYSPLLPLFYFISAVAVGLGMTIVESNLSARFLGHDLENNLLAGLGKAAAVVLGIYVIVKVYDLIARGVLGYLMIPGFHSTLYWAEVLLGVLVPMAILATRRGRENPRMLLISGWLIVGGVVFNRVNTALLSWWNYTNGGEIYVPSLGEVTVTISLISIGVVAFGLIAKYFPVFVHDQHVHAPAE